MTRTKMPYQPTTRGQSHRWTYPERPRPARGRGWMTALWWWVAFIGVAELLGRHVGVAPVLIALAFAVESVNAR